MLAKCLVAFLKDIVGALQSSARLNDMRPVQGTLNAWRSTLLFVGEPDHPEFLTEMIDGGPMTVEGIRAWVRGSGEAV